MADQNKPDSRWGLNPATGRYCLRASSTWRRLVKAGIVVDAEVEAQLAAPATGTRRKYERGQNVAIKADRDHVSNTIAENFDVSRLTGRQLEEIAEQLARMKAPAAARKKAPRRALPAQATQASDSDEEAYTETSVAGTEAEPATELEEPERPIRVVRHIVGRRR